MKTYILILMLAFNFSAFGQTSTDVTISGQKWDFKREASQTQTVSTTTADPEEWVQHARISQRNASRGLPPPPPPSARLTRTITPGAERIVYIYEAKVKNTGKKTIQAVTWEYIFYAPDKKRELGRLKFTSLKEIRPGEEKKIVIRTAYPPTKLISATSVNNKVKDQYAEEVILKSVEYTDGSVD